MKTTILATILILTLILIPNLYSQGIPYGQEFQVNTNSYRGDIYSTVASLSNGGFVICWYTWHWQQNDPMNGIYIQQYDSYGIKRGKEFHIDTNTYDARVSPLIAELSKDIFVVCWHNQGQDGSGNGVFCQLYDTLGNEIGNNFQVNSYIQGDQDHPSIAVLSKGGFVVCWNSKEQDGSQNGVFGQLFDASGFKKGNEFRVNTYWQGYQSMPVIATLSNGEFVVCWGSQEQDGHYDGIFGQLYDTSGIKKGNEFQVNTTSEGFQYSPIISTFSNGEFVICWNSNRKNDMDVDILGQFYDASGNKKQSEFRVNTYTDNFQNNPTIGMLSDNRFVIGWNSMGQDGSVGGVFAQIFNTSGDKIGNEFQVNTYTYANQSDPKMIKLYDGKFLVCWSSYGQDGSELGIFAQMYDGSGNKIYSEFQINSHTEGSQYKQEIADLSNDRFLVCWVNKELDHNFWKNNIFWKIYPNKPLIHDLMIYSLIDPVNDLTLSVTRVIFRWQQPTNTIECYPWELTFDLHIDTDLNFSNPQIIKGIEDTTYTIDSLELGKTYFWKVLAKNLAGDSLWSAQQDWGFFISHNATSVETADENVPKQFELFQNYPNPFNASTEIKYSLPQEKSSYHVTLKIYDITGRLVNTLVDQNQAAGTYSVSWDGRDVNGNDVSSEIYFYTVHVGKFKTTKKILLLE